MPNLVDNGYGVSVYEACLSSLYCAIQIWHAATAVMFMCSSGEQTVEQWQLVVRASCA